MLKVTKLKSSFEGCHVLTNHKSRIACLNYRDREKFYLPCHSILLRAADMKCAAVFIVVSIAFASQTFAVLRPLFPAKAGATVSGEAISTRRRFDSIFWLENLHYSVKIRSCIQSRGVGLCNLRDYRNAQLTKLRCDDESAIRMSPLRNH